jgi:serine phosphatase RsbU (regulator of sigma subunit)
VRAEIDHGLGPAEVLERLNRAMLRASGERPGRFATVAHARLRGTPEGAGVRLASAGHPPPLLLRGGRVTPVTAPGTLLGIYPDVTLTEVSFDLHHGEIMVLYTDGVTEARGGDGLYGTERLARALACVPAGTADEVADHLLADVDAFQHEQQRDDIAILVIEAVS